MITEYYVMEEITETTIAIVRDKTVAEWLIQNYIKPCFYRVVTH